MTETSTTAGKWFLEDCVSIDTWCSTGPGLLSPSVSSASSEVPQSCDTGRSVSGRPAELGPCIALKRVSSAKNPD